VSDTAEDVIAVIRAGARGYVTKTISGADLADAVRRVHGGDAVFSPRLAGFVLDAFAGAPAARGRERIAPGRDAELDQLTPREREVLQHIARGYMYKEIALRLGISAKTVEAHVSAVLRKLQLSSRHELSRWAAERQMIDHIKLHVADAVRSKAFYEAALAPLGYRVVMEPVAGVVVGMGTGFPDFWLATSDAPTVAHVALRAEDRAAVDAFHAAALAAGGVDNGAPGLRPQYHPGYYGAFVLDPDGNNVEAVHHTFP